MLNETMVRGLMAATLLASAAAARADVFNMGGTISGGTWTGPASLQFVTVGDPGNVADTTVMSEARPATVKYYVCQMAKYDVTLAQYVAFLNAVAQTDTYGLYNSWHGHNLSDRRYRAEREPGQFQLFRYRLGSRGGKYAGVLCHVGRCGPVLQLAAKRPADQRRRIAGGTTETGSYNLNGATSSTALMAVTGVRAAHLRDSHGKRMVQGRILRRRRHRRRVLAVSDAEQHRAGQLSCLCA